MSTTEGKSWTGGPVLAQPDFISVQSSGDLLAAATRTDILFSKDGGATWRPAGLTSSTTNIRGVTVTPEGVMLVASREGAFRSSDSGATWQHVGNGLPDKNISSIIYDSSKKRLLATSTATGVIFESRDDGHRWHRGPDAGYPLRRISIVRGRLVAATPFDGVVAQPENDDQSALVETGSSD
jgi:photosystem II stability/assembly factor-like uncharacterized protein